MSATTSQSFTQAITIKLREPARARNLELVLLVIACGICAGAMVLVQLGTKGRLFDTGVLWVGAGILGLALVMHVVLRGRREERRPVRPAGRARAQRHRHRRDLPDRRPQRPDRLGRDRREADRLDDARDGARDDHGRRGPEPPLPAALPLHLHGADDLPAAHADAARDRREHRRRPRLDPHRPVLVPAGRAREDHDGAVLRRLPRHGPRLAVDRRSEVPRHDLPARPGPRSDPGDVGCRDGGPRLPARPRHRTALLRAVPGDDLRRHRPAQLGRHRSDALRRRRDRGAGGARVRARPLRAVARPVRPDHLRPRDAGQLPARAGPVRLRERRHHGHRARSGPPVHHPGRERRLHRRVPRRGTRPDRRLRDPGAVHRPGVPRPPGRVHGAGRLRQAARCGLRLHDRAAGVRRRRRHHPDHPRHRPDDTVHGRWWLLPHRQLDHRRDAAATDRRHPRRTARPAGCDPAPRGKAARRKEASR